MAPKLLVYTSQMWGWVSYFVQNPLLLDRALAAFTLCFGPVMVGPFNCTGVCIKKLMKEEV